MSDFIYNNGDTILKSLISLVLIFMSIIIITRGFGLRTFAKMSSIDFASTIAVGSVLASVVLNENQSIVKGFVILVGIIGFQFLFSYATRKSKSLKSLMTNAPRLLMKDGQIIYKNLKQTNVSKADLIAKLREANVFCFDDVKAVVLESTGDISVLHTEREQHLSDDIMTDVEV